MRITSRSSDIAPGVDVWCEARDALGEGEHTAEDPHERWQQCEEDADPRDLEHVIAVDSFEPIGDVPGLAEWQRRFADQKPSNGKQPLPASSCTGARISSRKRSHGFGGTGTRFEVQEPRFCDRTAMIALEMRRTRKGTGANPPLSVH